MLSTRGLCLIVIRGNRSCLLRNMSFLILCLHSLLSICFLILCLHPLSSLWRSFANINKRQLPFPFPHNCVQHPHNTNIQIIIANSQSHEQTITWRNNNFNNMNRTIILTTWRNNSFNIYMQQHEEITVSCDNYLC